MSVERSIRRSDTASRTLALGMALVAWLIGVALEISSGFFSRTALLLVTVAIVVSAVVTLLPPVERLEALPDATIATLIAALAATNAILLAVAAPAPWWGGVAIVAAVLLLQAFVRVPLRTALVAAGVAGFCVVAGVAFRRLYPSPPIDVWVFQQMAASGLLEGINPYMPHYPNLYTPDTPFYGPGVVDAVNPAHITVGLPYPPASLLIVLPAYVIGGDIRYAEVAALAGSACLMAAAGTTTWNRLVVPLFLLTSRVFFVIGQAWTESVFVLTFSLVMFAALRWRRALPFAFGLFLATKQYSILAVPLLVLLVEPDEPWTAILRPLATAIVVAAVVTVPFFAWSPRDFWRSVVEFQFVQPLRMDALSHLVWLHARMPAFRQLVWLPFVLLVPTVVVAVWKSARSPAAFAGAVAFVNLVFIAFNKQAFTNYYYFVIAASAWAAAAASGRQADDARLTPSRSVA